MTTTIPRLQHIVSTVASLASQSEVPVSDSFKQGIYEDVQYSISKIYIFQDAIVISLSGSNSAVHKATVIDLASHDNTLDDAPNAVNDLAVRLKVGISTLKCRAFGCGLASLL